MMLSDFLILMKVMLIFIQKLKGVGGFLLGRSKPPQVPALARN